MRDVGAVLRAGGVVPIDALKNGATSDVPSEAIDARVFSHPGVAGRTIVRLTPTVMAPGVDLEMATLGFAREAVVERLGRQRFRALGFPGWALVHDPKRARFALDVMKDVKAAAKRAQSKPGHAKDAFVAIGEKLARSVPHFLPSYWEEAGRIFIANENTMYASQCFEKAREAEAAHALPIDEDVRVGVYLEFALGGALAAKSISGYARDLVEAYGAAKAYPRFRELGVRRLLGGIPPWSGFAKEMRTLAKQAGLDVAREDEALLEEVIDAPALAKASNEFWTSYRAPAIAVAKAKAGARKRLRHLFPTIGVENAPAWIAMLDAAGAIAVFEREADGDSDDAEPSGAAAAWFSRCIAFTEGHACLVPILERIAGRLKRDAVPLDLVGVAHWRGRLYVDLCERALELGVPVADPTPHSSFALDRAFEADPVLTQAHPTLGPRLFTAVAERLGKPEFEARSKASRGLRAARAQWLTQHLGELVDAALPGLAEGLATLVGKHSVALYAEIPDAVARLESIDVSRALARSLRAGSLAELGSPAIDAALASFPEGSSVELGGNYPHPAFFNSTKVIALLHGAQRIEHDFVLPPKAVVQAVLVIDGELLVQFRDAAHKSHAYWSSAPHDVFQPDGYLWGLQHYPLSWSSDDVGTTLGGAAIRRGTRALPHPEQLVCDATKAWITSHDWSRGPGRSRLIAHELDVRTGNKGRASWPHVVESEWLDPERPLAACTLMPASEGLTASPLGLRDGLVGWGMLSATASRGAEVIAIDGARIALRIGEADRRESAPLRIPGDLQPRRLDSVSRRGHGTQAQRVIFDAEGRRGTTAGAETPALLGLPFVPPHMLLHFMSARDLAGSRALRGCTDEVAKALLEAATLDRVLSRGQSTPAQTTTRAAIAKGLPVIAAKQLVDAVTELAGQAAARTVEIAEALMTANATADGTGDSALDAQGLDDATLIRTLGEHTESVRRVFHNGGFEAQNANDPRRTMRELASVVGALVQREKLSIAGTASPFQTDHWAKRWERWPRMLRGLAFRAMLSTTPKVARDATVTLLRAMRDGLLATPAKAARTLTIKPVNDEFDWPANEGARTAIQDESGFFIRRVKSWNTRDDSAIELSFDGKFRVHPEFTIIAETRFDPEKERAWLDAFLGVAESPALPTPLSVTLDDVGALVAATGLTRAEAAVVLTGLVRVTTPADEFFDEALRKSLDLKAKEIAIARDRMKDLMAFARLEFFTRAAPADASRLVSGDEATRRAALIEGLTAACTHKWGRTAVLDEALVAACDRDLDLQLPTPVALGALLDPPNAALLRPSKRTLDELFSFGHRHATDGFGAVSLKTMTTLLLWANHALAVGDPARAQVPALHAAMLTALADPNLLLPLESWYVEPTNLASVVAFVHAVPGAPTAVEAFKNSAPDGRDDGHVISAYFPTAHRALMAFRPAKIDADHVVASKVPSAFAFKLVTTLRSPDLTALVARVASSPLAAGAFEANPLLSAPDLVAAVGARLKLSQEAAAHYLQLLALGEPTTRAVQQWNGWSTKTYKATITELLGKKLVVEGKRERAGREVFLPGAWTKIRTGKALPYETWKTALYADALASVGRLLPTRPHAALFAAAWDRVTAGDAPSFEEV